MQPSATHEPGSYIVWFDSQYETAEAAAEALNGTSLPPLQPGQSPEDLVRQRLRTLGYAENLLSVLEPVAEYVANENRHGSGPSRCYNSYTAAVFIPPQADTRAWLDAFCQPDFARQLSDAEAAKVFVGVMEGRTLGYCLAVCAAESAMPDEDDPFLLVPAAALPGYDDLAYLLKDVEYAEGNYSTVLAQTLSAADAQWLYARNRETVFNWMMNRGLALHDFGYNADVVLEQPEKIRWELVYRWACDTVKTYLDKLK